MGSPQVNRTAALADDDLLIFVHIPKTAGTTFKRMLGRQFPASRMPKIGPDYQGSINQIKALSPQDKARVQCISGHIPFGVDKYFEHRKLHYVSFVRDPVDRVLSEYFFLAKRPQLMHLIGLDASTSLTPEAFLEHQTSMGLQDFQTRVLSGYGDLVESVLPPYAPMTVEDEDALIERIAASFSLVGTVEHFDESLLLMKQLFGWRNVCYISRNVARASSRRSELKQALAAEIRRLNPMDCKLHTYFKNKMDAEIARRGEDFSRELRRFRRLNRLYSQAWRIYRATGLRRIGKLVAKVQAGKARSAAMAGADGKP